MSTKVYLIRHGEAEGNLYRWALGVTEGRLTAQGVRQANAAAERFSSVSIDRAYTSPMLRTRQTGEIVCRAHNVELIADEAFREINLGIWENMQWGEILSKYPDEYATFMQDVDNWKINGCETSIAAGRRFYDRLISVAAEHDGDNILVFTHGAVIRAFLIEVLRRKNGASPIDVKHSDNTAVTLLDVTGDTVDIVYMNDNSHLGELSNYKRHFALKEKVGFETNLRVREYLPEDEHFYASCLNGIVSGDVLKQEFFAGNERAYIAFSGEQPAGVLQLREKNGDQCITVLTLAEGFRGYDLGVQLIGVAVDIGRQTGADKIRTYPFSEKDSGFFKHYEFSPQGEAGEFALDINLSNYDII